MNKRQQQIYERYLASDDYYLSNVYGRYSSYKERAWYDCLERCSAKNGYAFRIISHNSMQFTIGFLYKKNDKTMFHYETAQNIKEWEVNI